MLNLAVITDSTKIHTGFSTVAKAILTRLHQSGKYAITQYGLMDSHPDMTGEVLWNFIPTPHFDDLGHQTYTTFMRGVRPDVVLIIGSPSNAFRYRGIKSGDCAIGGRNAKVVLYSPIEGHPLSRDSIEGLQMADELVSYCKYGQEITKELANRDSVIAYHGVDHVDWFRYPEDVRQKMKGLVGFDKFIIGSVGVNKRTKGMVELLQVAREIKDRGHKGVFFYLHTNPDRQTMLGYDLRYLAEYYGVDDIVQWRIVFDNDSYWKGHDAANDTFQYIRDGNSERPSTREERGMFFASFDMRAIYNCMDLYIDLSQNEGWGLPLHEAMACGVPSLSLRDGMVRTEVFEGGPDFIEPLPHRTWSTLHTGAKLVTVDPKVAADKIEHYLENKDELEPLGKRCYDVAWKYKWDDAAEVIDAAIQRTQD